MAARFGAKIIPFGSVGEDDIGEVSLIFLTRRHFDFPPRRYSMKFSQKYQLLIYILT